MNQAKLWLCVLLSSVPALAQIEPNAGSWKTWVISSGKDFRVPPPPGAEATKDEIDWLKNYGSTGAQVEEQIRFWDAGPPVYRWEELVVNGAVNGQPLSPFRFALTLTFRLPCTTQRLPRGNPSTFTTGGVPARWSQA